MDPSNTFILFTTFILLSAFFSWTELALMSLSTHKVESLIKQRKSWALVLKKIKENNERLLITILIWNNLVNVAASALATVAAWDFAKTLWLWDWTWIAIATWTVTLILLLFWEITPKTLAIKYAEKISLSVAPIYKMLMFILLPIVIFAELFLRLVSKITWTNNNKWEDVSAEDVNAFIEMSNEMWAVEDNEHSQIRWILTMNDTEVRTVMTPRVNVIWLSDELAIDEALNIFFNNSHSRLPVYKGNLDNIVWILTFREIIELKEKWNNLKKLNSLDIKKPITVPWNQFIDSVLNTFQKSHKHMAIVIDEYGWVDWIVTLEDIVEEVFGEIQDETDKEKNKTYKIWDNTIITDWYTIFKNIVEELDIDVYNLDNENTENYLDENINYIINDILDRFPKNGEEINMWWISFIVKSVKWKVIEEVEITYKKETD